MWSAIEKIVNNLFAFLLSLWESFQTWIVDLFCGVLEFVLSFFSSLVAAIPVPSVFTGNSDFWSSIPGQGLYIINQLKIPTVLLILAAAYGIRFLINLIPSWATRV